MGRRVPGQLPLVVSGRHDPAVEERHGPDGHVTVQCGGVGLVEGHTHRLPIAVVQLFRGGRHPGMVTNGAVLG